MTSKRPVIFHNSSYLSLEDPIATSNKYKKGDRFMLRPESLLEDGWEEEFAEDLRKFSPVIVEIDSFTVDAQGCVTYKMKVISYLPGRMETWSDITLDMLEEDFISYKDCSAIRFRKLELE